MKLCLLLAVILFSTLSAAQNQSVNVSIDASRAGPPISKYIYGQFLEHIGGIVNNGVWAEMLDDRKFYNQITSHPAAEPPSPRGRASLRHWLPIGGDEFVIMDTVRPYVGEHTPMVKLSGTEEHGILQSGLAVRKGKAYAGHVILAGAGSASVRVALVWGDKANDRQEVLIGKLGPDYRRFDVEFISLGDSNDARLEIVAKGNGAIHIGTVSLMPVDNIKGFRAEVVAALKQLHSGVYRFPGGNFVSAHEWRNAIGDPDKRPPILDPVWHAVQPNDVGTDEFITLCRLLDVEPYITVNAGFGDAWSAAQLVEYVNGEITTPMGRLRASNGHPQPYKVKFWGIGNEPWGAWQMGFMPVETSIPYRRIQYAWLRKILPFANLPGHNT